METLKEHKWAIIFVVVVLVLVGLFFGRTLFQTVPTGPTPQDAALENIKTLIISKNDCADALPQLAALASSSPTFVEAYSWEGVCQFQSNQIAAAKASFEKVLSLDSTNAAAQNYLKVINALPPGGTITFAGAPTMSQVQFQSILGFTPDPTKFSFIRLAVVPVSTSTETVAAFYKSALSEGDTATYFNSRFKKSTSITYAVNTQTTSGQVYATVTFTKPN